MSTLTGLISSGGGGGSKVPGLVSDTTFTAATTISCPSGKSLRILGLLQIDFQTTSSYNIVCDLSMGSRTIFSGERLADYAPSYNDGYDDSQGRIGVGVANDGSNTFGYIDGKVDEDIVISNLTRTGTPRGLLIYTVMEDA